MDTSDNVVQVVYNGERLIARRWDYDQTPARVLLVNEDQTAAQWARVDMVREVSA